ncbi:rhodanese-like domain-containing protein [Psychrosphaera saromensis]|jgi:rhodanese-related sulfurtransferase|uniref:Rhodanese-like domain-containing protein n=1 Tax=Psychrosphaera saromensis TaxID=716813 RepID=A0A2S7UR37_9GAMM|nr:rhodanese-like domain-containing protein [Psychrosphaera saromensis]PQJ52436.1 rhodanese-like domain-containing protein [Psychrosphaera saromensis]GHB73730.1 rhodanese-like domain-containing protein [Psychrosphaera saromensis]GLQ13393.1 rhodanese-like domain-containing protein [Psychrosphaera saromensis]
MEQFVEFIGNHYMLGAAWALLFLMLVMSWLSGATSSVKMVSSHDLTMLVNRSNGQVVDTRAIADFNKGRITDSIHLPMDKITSGQFGALENKKADPIVIVCNTGMTAKGAAKQMSKAGFEQVSVLQGGIQSWISASLPVVKK